ncbi:MAG: DUF4166 domain-containing protein [Parvularculaceae bacterium]
MKPIDPSADSPFRALLSETDWMSLPPAARARFSHKVRDGESVLYRGQTTHLRMSRLGRLIAQAARLIGAPLPLDAKAERRPAIVAVTDDPSGAGQIWTRVYARRRGFPQMVNSVKKFAGPTGLEEHVGGGVSMSLALSVEAGALLFRSVDYYFTAFGRRFILPRALTPGAMTIGHHDLGACAFLFTLTLKHPLFGVLIEQTTVFKDMEESHDRRSRLESHRAADALWSERHALAS